MVMARIVVLFCILSSINTIQSQTNDHFLESQVRFKRQTSNNQPARRFPSHRAFHQFHFQPIRTATINRQFRVTKPPQTPITSFPEHVTLPSVNQVSSRRVLPIHSTSDSKIKIKEEKSPLISTSIFSSTAGVAHFELPRKLPTTTGPKVLSQSFQRQTLINATVIRKYTKPSAIVITQGKKVLRCPSFRYPISLLRACSEGSGKASVLGACPCKASQKVRVGSFSSQSSASAASVHSRTHLPKITTSTSSENKRNQPILVAPHDRQHSFSSIRASKIPTSSRAPTVTSSTAAPLLSTTKYISRNNFFHSTIHSEQDENLFTRITRKPFLDSKTSQERQKVLTTTPVRRILPTTFAPRTFHKEAFPTTRTTKPPTKLNVQVISSGSIKEIAKKDKIEAGISLQGKIECINIKKIEGHRDQQNLSLQCISKCSGPCRIQAADTEKRFLTQQRHQTRVHSKLAVSSQHSKNKTVSSIHASSDINQRKVVTAFKQHLESEQDVKISRPEKKEDFRNLSTGRSRNNVVITSTTPTTSTLNRQSAGGFNIPASSSQAQNRDRPIRFPSHSAFHQFHFQPVRFRG